MAIHEQQREKEVATIKELLRAFPDFPQKGIVFQDIFPIFQDPAAVKLLITHFERYCEEHLSKVDVVVGLDARGFLLGPMLACQLGAAFVPVRKQGKLPGPCISAQYTKEYGTDHFDMQLGAIQPNQNVIILDDLIATGGSASAAAELVKQSGGNILSFLFIIELITLDGAKQLPAPVYSMLQF
ncbi:adenine phosphoribosyltransferase [Syncephalis pseudoplumigaleata]|uniref:adenine phosphoribosyltransferase n=1 Tax=Syncephalis pseudoplumigaleata TaxID=1712513 RepID=A0A4P9Z119_9FUNG|nr:adenine phosphoribosyltransferase [Syncephalis pseudoplumigaleata]|eukprot:RKP26157.1 adenine phosphoribosyltransferase [Syncephalis pseudoplumigaleata]